MKTLILKNFAMTLLFAATLQTNLTAATTDVNLRLSGDDKVEIHLKGASSQIITIQMYNGDGLPVFIKKVAPGDRAVVKHDVSILPAGLYTYQIVEGTELIYSAQIVVCPGGTSICSSMTDGAVAAILQPDDDHVLVRINQPVGCKTTIRVKDRQGNMIYNRRIAETGNHKITHDISGFPAGNYRVEVLDGRRLIAQRKIIHQ
jgi:hypothetical protein